MASGGKDKGIIVPIVIKLDVKITLKSFFSLLYLLYCLKMHCNNVCTCL